MTGMYIGQSLNVVTTGTGRSMKRIQELMSEAVEFRLDPDSKHYEAQVSPEELEVFAELIIRECAKVADKYVRDGDCDIAKIITRNFGLDDEL